MLLSWEWPSVLVVIIGGLILLARRIRRGPSFLARQGYDQRLCLQIDARKSYKEGS